MRKYKVGDHLLVKLTSGRIVEATVKAIVGTTEGVRLHVSFGDETARIYEWRIVIRQAGDLEKKNESVNLKQTGEARAVSGAEFRVH